MKTSLLFIWIFLISAQLLYSQDAFKYTQINIIENSSNSYQIKNRDNLDSLINDPNRDYSYWLAFGIGGNYYGTTLYVNFSYVKKIFWYSLRFCISGEHQNLNNIDLVKLPKINCRELGFLIGIFSRSKHVGIGIGAGIAYLNALDRGELIESAFYDPIDLSILSIPVEMKVRFSFNGVIGFGFTVTSNINRHKTFYGGIIELSFGLL